MTQTPPPHEFDAAGVLEAQAELISRLSARIDELEAALRARGPAPAPVPFTAPGHTASGLAPAHTEPGHTASSRRRFLRLAGVTAAGAATVVAGRVTPAAAADGDDVRQGTATSGTTQTSITNTTNSATSSDVAAFKGTGGANAVGLFGQASGNAGAGVQGVSDLGYGVAGTSNSGYSLYAFGVSRLGMGEHITSGIPTVGQYALGDLFRNGSGDLYVCVVAGTAAGSIFRKVAGPATAGSFHPISPLRVLDSRQTTRIAAPEVRTVSIGTAVPAGVLARAATINITVTQTSAGGYLTVFPGDVTTVPQTSVLNWTAADSTIANGTTIRLGNSNDLKVTSPDPSSSTHVLIDVMGYWA